ncbi:ABC transporter substrate-binding protein [Oceanidesulfovibrio indonesiensis]|uniref:ABC transporter substrate-binding protein n=1 Tax=Oceanidesulfovibrio indonesiensis TaxID=54767 RepID=A0A7M3MCW7_9BACT|nr:ABC transporter substrate-binding protein [Oceanidesulfovibrio indonesiensis]TVM16280.1 ABC transporter substrate-binding protein [Oceanidesulfovibrio indonesiensis]
MPSLAGAAERDTLKIGAVASATGPASFLGQPEKLTAEMITEKINAEGGVNGMPIELIFYDDETDVNKCVLAVQKLVRKDKVDAIIGPTTSGNTLAVMRIASQAGIPLLSMASAEKIVDPVDPWVFKVTPSDSHAVTRILQHAEKNGYKRLAIITVSDGFGQSGRDFLQKLIPEAGMELVADELYGPNDTDMTAQLTSIKNVNPDAIICWGTNPGPAVIAKNRVQLGIETPLYMSHGVASKKFIELAGDAAEGLMLPAGRLIVAEQIPDDHPQKQVLMDYKESYEKTFQSPVSTFGGHAYDAIGLLAAAMDHSGNDSSAEALRNGLEKVKGFVGTAGIFTLSPEDHNGLDATAFEMITIKNGDWKIMD